MMMTDCFPHSWKNALPIIFTETDIVFLDVEMPGLSGIYIGNELKKKNEAVIIFVISSFSEYLDEAMRFHVFRYLSKPLERQRLFRNLRDALQVYHSTAAKLLIETRQGCYTVLASDIISIESLGRKITVHKILAGYSEYELFFSAPQKLYHQYEICIRF